MYSQGLPAAHAWRAVLGVDGRHNFERVSEHSSDRKEKVFFPDVKDVFRPPLVTWDVPAKLYVCPDSMVRQRGMAFICV